MDEQPDPDPAAMEHSSEVQVVSDLHLEYGPQYSTYTLPVTAPFLLLCGNTGRLINYEGYLEFLESHVTRYRKVFLVLGLHDFHGVSYEDGLEIARVLTEEPTLDGKLVLLHQTRWDDPDSRLTILGCTLWSPIPEPPAIVVNNYDGNVLGGWPVEQYRRIHAEEVDWLRSSAAQLESPEDSGRQVLVATHYGPFHEYTAPPQPNSDPSSPLPVIPLVDQESWGRVDKWAFGHENYPTAVHRNGITLISNQRCAIIRATPGPPRVRGDRYIFDPNLTVSWDPDSSSESLGSVSSAA
ncbi:putative calcineurin-like phosphoesterase [Hypomontagnella monticulosa]|nr:putative calcineurin-like phosphoesterase [Hypomontagnella monticulosa]